MPKLIVRPRQSGKTSESVEWVKAGKKTNSYPFWTRVLLVHSIYEAIRVRKEFELDYRQVFEFDEWRRARLGPLPVEIAIDNMDIILERFLWSANHIRLVTWNGNED